VAFKSVRQTVESGTWHAIRVDFEEDELMVSFDGKKVIKATDETMKDARKVGLWTEADSLTISLMAKNNTSLSKSENV
jgi:hypothetical protein